MIKAAVVLAGLVAIAVLWSFRLDVVHLRQNDYLLVNRWTGSLRFCREDACSPVFDAVQVGRPGAYDDLVPKK